MSETWPVIFILTVFFRQNKLVVQKSWRQRQYALHRDSIVTKYYLHIRIVERASLDSKNCLWQINFYSHSVSVWAKQQRLIKKKISVMHEKGNRVALIMKCTCMYFEGHCIMYDRMSFHIKSQTKTFNRYK